MRRCGMPLTRLFDCRVNNVSPARLERIGHGYHTFVTRRFDRDEQGHRRFFTSAMALLGRTDSEQASYLDLAEFIAARQGVPGKIDQDLRELFRLPATAAGKKQQKRPVRKLA